MSKFLPHKRGFLIIATCLIATGLVLPHSAHAAWWDIAGDAVTWVFSPIAVLIQSIAHLGVYITGTFLNKVIDITVLQMANNIGTKSTLGITISNTWGTVRDLANMFFIFILLYTAILTIFGKGNFKETIKNLVVAALLINFSLFFTKVIIDAGNLLALVFYKAVAPGALNGSVLNAGIANTFVRYMGLTHLLDPSLAGHDLKSLGINALLSSVVLVIAAFIFLVVGIMFVIRYVVLVLVLILSPLMFASYILPKGIEGSGYTSKWWKALLGQTFFAPVYFFMTWIVLQVMDGVQSAAKYNPNWNFAGKEITANGAASIGTDPGLVTTIFNYGLIVAFLIASVVVAKKMSDSSAPGIKGVTKWATGFMSGTVVGAPLRKFVGGAANNMANNPELIKKSEDSRRSRLQLLAAKKLANASFDVRNANIPLQTVGEAIETTAGTTKLGKALGLNDLNLKSVEVNSGVSDMLGTGPGVQRGRRQEVEDSQKRLRDRAKEEAADIKKATTKTEMAAGLEAAEKTKFGSRGTDQASVDKLAKTVQEMSTKDVTSQKAKTLQIPEVARNLTAKQLEAIMEDKENKFTDDEKAEIHKQHFAPIDEAVDAVVAGTANDDQKNAIKNLADKELEMVSTELLNPNHPDLAKRARSQAFIKTLGQGQIDTLTKSGNNQLTSAEKQAIKDERARPLKEAFAAGTPAGYDDARKIMSSMSAPALAKLDAGTPASLGTPAATGKLDDPNIIEIYTPAILNQLVGQSDFNSNKAAAVRNAIESAVAASTTASAALTDLQTPRPRTGGAFTPPNSAERQAIFAALPDDRERRLVKAAEWLGSPSGQEMF